MIYNNYTSYLKGDNLLMSFKSDPYYNSILEHVSLPHGEKYLDLILKEFPDISKQQIIEFCQLNDSIGSPIKYLINNTNLNIECSPTSLRYVYHSLLILKHIKDTKCKNIVEVGCGYGGLCLAINYFMKDYSIIINNYNLIDLSEPCNLIKEYLNLHKNNIYTKNEIHDSSTYGSNIYCNDLFFISNYCYTEIEKEYNINYTNILLSKVNNGFIIWQNGGNNGGYPIKNCDDIIRKKTKLVIEEKPQTDAGYDIFKNYFVYF